MDAELLVKKEASVAHPFQDLLEPCNHAVGLFQLLVGPEIAAHRHLDQTQDHDAHKQLNHMAEDHGAVELRAASEVDEGCDADEGVQDSGGYVDGYVQV